MTELTLGVTGEPRSTLERRTEPEQSASKEFSTLDEPVVAEATAVRWPADRFYWALIEAPTQRPGPLAPGLLLDLQEHVPIDVSVLHAVGVPVPATTLGKTLRTLVCAVPREALRELEGSALTLTPLAAPDGLGAGNVVPLEGFNLLVGDFEPPSVRRRRTLAHAVSMAGVIALAALVAIGLSRRTAALTRSVSEPVAAAAAVQVSPAQLAALRAFAARAATEPVPLDAAAPLAALLRVWPTAGAGRRTEEVQSLAVDARRIALTVSVEGDPAEFLALVRAPEGFTLEQPGMVASDDRTRVALTFIRTGSEGSTPGGPRP